jgi:heat shock protein HslJ
MKKAICIVAIATLFVACGSNTSKEEANASQSQEAPATDSAASEPEMKVWTFAAYGAADALTQAPADIEITLMMDLKSNRISGNAACNNYNGQLERTAVGKLISTKKACPPPLMDMETKYLQLLEKVTATKIEGDRLVMTTDDGQQLVFKA